MQTRRETQEHETPQTSDHRHEPDRDQHTAPKLYFADEDDDIQPQKSPAMLDDDANCRGTKVRLKTSRVDCIIRHVQATLNAQAKEFETHADRSGGGILLLTLAEIEPARSGSSEEHGA